MVGSEETVLVVGNRWVRDWENVGNPTCDLGERAYLNLRRTSAACLYCLSGSLPLALLLNKTEGPLSEQPCL